MFKHILSRAALGLGMLATTVSAMAAYPEKPIQLVAPYAAGGAADVLSRLLARQLEGPLGQPVVVENKPGAGTVIGAQAVAKARPDGYTLLLSANSTFSINPALMPKLPYDSAKDFEPIGLVGSVALAILVNTKSPEQTLAQLVASARAKPDGLSYGSFGNATAAHFGGEMFSQAAGIRMTHVPYRGSAPAMADLLGGQIQITVDTVVAAAPQIKAGKVRALAVLGAKRSALLPDVPTAAESGYPSVDISSWIALVAPHGLPPDVKHQLDKALATVMNSPDMIERMKSTGFEASYRPIADWSRFVGEDIARIRAIAERARISAE